MNKINIIYIYINLFTLIFLSIVATLQENNEKTGPFMFSFIFLKSLTQFLKNEIKNYIMKKLSLSLL